MTRRYVGNHLRNKERIVLRSVFFIQSVISGFFFKCVQTANTGSYNYTYTVTVKIFRFLKATVLDSFLGCNKCILGIEVELTQFATVGDML